MLRIQETLWNAVESLRDSVADEEVERNKRIAPGIWFTMDESWKGVEAQYQTGRGSLIEISLRAPVAGRWFTLNMDLGDEDLSGTRFIGIAASLRSLERTLIMRACIRSFNHDGGYNDVFLPDYFLAHADYSSQMSGLWCQENDALVRPAKWRMLILFLETSSFELTVEDLALLIF